MKIKRRFCEIEFGVECIRFGRFISEIRWYEVYWFSLNIEFKQSLDWKMLHLNVKDSFWSVDVKFLTAIHRDDISYYTFERHWNQMPTSFWKQLVWMLSIHFQNSFPTIFYSPGSSFDDLILSASIKRSILQKYGNYSVQGWLFSPLHRIIIDSFS